jgi:hypothetical protein
MFKYGRLSFDQKGESLLVIEAPENGLPVQDRSDEQAALGSFCGDWQTLIPKTHPGSTSGAACWQFVLYCINRGSFVRPDLVFHDCLYR